MIHTIELLKDDITDYYDLLKIHTEFKILEEHHGDKEFFIYTYNSHNISYKYYDYMIIRDNRLKHIADNTVFKKELGYLKIIVNPSKLLDKRVITDGDYRQFTEKFYTAWYNTFNTRIDLENNVKLNRIDYKYDFYTIHKKLYLKLLGKTAPNKFLEQSKKSNTYYKSDSYNINLYDKLEEREAKDKSIDSIDVLDLDKLLRLEIQLKHNRIDYNYRQYGLIPNVLNYWNTVDYTYYLNTILRGIIYNGNYYNLYHSKKILQRKYKPSMVNKLIEFQKYISMNDIKAAKTKYPKTTFNNYIKLLEGAGVNPIPIPKGEGITNLKNLFSFTNKNIYLLDNYKLKAS